MKDSRETKGNTFYPTTQTDLPLWVTRPNPLNLKSHVTHVETLFIIQSSPALHYHLTEHPVSL